MYQELFIDYKGPLLNSKFIQPRILGQFDIKPDWTQPISYYLPKYAVEQCKTSDNFILEDFRTVTSTADLFYENYSYDIENSSKHRDDHLTLIQKTTKMFKRPKIPQL